MFLLKSWGIVMYRHPQAAGCSSAHLLPGGPALLAKAGQPTEQNKSNTQYTYSCETSTKTLSGGEVKKFVAFGQKGNKAFMLFPLGSLCHKLVD